MLKFTKYTSLFLLLIPALLFVFSGCDACNPENDEVEFLMENCKNGDEFPDINVSITDDDDRSSWLATAANMLAYAGYGNPGTNVNDRANEIYQQLTAQFGTNDPGWPDAAIQWWLGSSHHNWNDGNLYAFPLLTGNRVVRPFDFRALPANMADLMQLCRIPAISLGWPVEPGDLSTEGSLAHSLACWGLSVGEAGDYSGIACSDPLTALQPELQQHSFILEDAQEGTPALWASLNYKNDMLEENQAWRPFIRNIMTLEKSDRSPGPNAKPQRVASVFLFPFPSGADVISVNCDMDLGAFDMKHLVRTFPGGGLVEPSLLGDSKLLMSAENFPAPEGDSPFGFITEAVISDNTEQKINSISVSFGGQLAVNYPEIRWHLDTRDLDDSEVTSQHCIAFVFMKVIVLKAGEELGTLFAMQEVRVDNYKDTIDFSLSIGDMSEKYSFNELQFAFTYDSPGIQNFWADLVWYPAVSSPLLRTDDLDGAPPPQEDDTSDDTTDEDPGYIASSSGAENEIEGKITLSSGANMPYPEGEDIRRVIARPN